MRTLLLLCLSSFLFSNKVVHSFIPVLRDCSFHIKKPGSVVDADTMVILRNTNKDIPLKAYKSKKQSGEDGSEQDEIRESPISTSNPAAPYLNILLPLILVYVSNQWSRYSISYLVDFSEAATPFKAMNVDLGFSQAQYGTLASIAFTVLFAGASLLAGTLADKYDRRVLTVGSCIAWSLAILATSFSADYSQVVVCRIIMGLMCAFATPSAYTLIRDTFPSDRTASASSLYGAGVYFGGALSSLSILLDNQWGWRGTMQTITVFGLIAASSAFLLLDPDKKIRKGSSKPRLSTTTSNVGDASQTMDSNGKDNTTSLLSGGLSILSSQRVQLLFLASFLRFCAGLSIAVWAAPYFRLTFPDNAAQYSVINAFIVSVCGFTSSVVGGALADRASKLVVSRGKDENFGKLLVPIIGSALAVPAWWMCLHAGTFQASMTWLAIEYLVAECWFGPVNAVLQSSVESNKGGLAQGMFVLTGALANLAPALLGTWYESRKIIQGGGGESLSTLLGFVVCLAYLTSAIAFTFSALSSTDRNKKVESTMQ
jgi:predicted MFS family arabinose efflux permease